MEQLATYLRTQYPEDREEIRRAQTLVSSVLPVFQHFFRDDVEPARWPYTVIDYRVAVSSSQSEAERRIEQAEGKNGRERPRDDYSESTNAMILFTLAALFGKLKNSILWPNIRPPFPIDTDELPPAFQKAFDALVKHLISPPAGRLKNRSQYATWSYTFGADDPFTLTWVLELIHTSLPRAPAILSQSISDLRPKLAEKANRASP